MAEEDTYKEIANALDSNDVTTANKLIDEIFSSSNHSDLRESINAYGAIMTRVSQQELKEQGVDVLPRFDLNGNYTATIYKSREGEAESNKVVTGGSQVLDGASEAYRLSTSNWKRPTTSETTQGKGSNG